MNALASGSGRSSGDHRPEGRARTRILNIAATQPSAAPEKPGTQPSAPSASSAPVPKSNPANGFSAQSLRTVAHDADGSGNGNGSDRPRQPIENQRWDRCGRCGRKFPASIRTGKRQGANGWRARL